MDSMDVEKIRNQIRNEEMGRIRALQKLKCGNEAVDAIIDIAISKGHGVADVEEYVNAVKKTLPSTALNWLMFDQKDSGAAAVIAGKEGAPEDFRMEQINRIIDAANRSVK